MKKFLFGILGLLFAVPAVATDSGAISSVTVAGLVAQNGTPTPTTPIDIVSNNGVLKVSKNLFDGNITNWAYHIGSPNSVTTNSGYRSIVVPVTAGQTYTFSRQSAAGNRFVYFFIKDVPETGLEVYNVNSNLATSTLKTTFTVPAEMKYVVFYFSVSGDDISGTQMQVERGSTATPYHPYGQIYTDGEVETITDSANHTATVATLLGVGDNRDTQNINTGAITRRVGVKVLDGTEDWGQVTLGGHNTYNISKSSLGTDSGVLPQRSDRFISTHYQVLTVESIALPNNVIWIGQNNVNFVIDATVMTLTQFKQWLAEQYAAGTPVIVIYPLATATTESVAGQTMTTAPVNNRTGGVTGMTITTLLSSGASVVTTIAADAIKIATTAYNSARFSPVVTELNDTIATIRSVVTNTINQTKAIADLQATKQTRPDEQCPAGKKCLLVEDDAGQPHWYEIIESPEVQ